VTGYPAAWRPLVDAGETQLDLPAGERIDKLLFDTKAGLIYVLDSAGSVPLLNSASLAEEATWPVNRGDMLLDPAGRRLFVARRDADETLILDPLNGNSRTASAAAATWPWTLAGGGTTLIRTRMHGWAITNTQPHHAF